MLPPSTTRSDGFSIGNPLFHELQMVAKRDSPLGTMYSFCSRDAIHGPVHKKKRRLDGGARRQVGARRLGRVRARLASFGGTERSLTLPARGARTCSLRNRQGYRGFTPSAALSPWPPAGAA